MDPLGAGERYLAEGSVETVNVFDDLREPVCYSSPGDGCFSVKSPAVARSGVLEPCIAVGLYSKRTNQAYIIHEIDMKTAGLDGQLDAIKTAEGGDLADVDVVAVGNSLSAHKPEYLDGDYVQGTLANRTYTEENLPRMLKQRGFRGEVRFRWLPDDGSGDLFIDAQAGEFRLALSRLRMRGRDVVEFDKKTEII
jgi:hypothetical protein